MSLEVIDLDVDLDGLPTLVGVSLTVADGETVAVLGPSGSGKSTLLRTVAGLVAPVAGTIRWDGDDLADVPPHERGFGFVFQAYALFEHLDVAGNVAFGLELRGVPGPQVRRRVDETLDLVGLGGMADRSVDRLSGGERQRVALARALVIDPPLLLLDEPLGAIDVALKERLLGDVAGLLDDRTALYVTHDHDEALAIGDRVAILREGRLVAVDTPEGLWSRPPDAWSARFLGHRNVWEDASPFGPGPLLVPEQAIRPADVGVAATVAASRFVGDGWRVEADVDGTPVTFRCADPIPAGTEVRLAADEVVAL
ncbi:MAG: ABC transporter ATP-binding protein [Acidimicrobiia bacterium]